jgi:hypothetical protein
MQPESTINSANSTQGDRILDLLKSRGYGQYVERYEFLDLQPRICDFTTRIFELRHKRDLNIQCEAKMVNGEKHSRYRLLPGSWRELRGKPEGERHSGETRQSRAEWFEKEFGKPAPVVDKNSTTEDFPLFAGPGQ